MVSEFKKPVYRAGETAEMLDVTTQTLHNYDKSGKLKMFRSDGGHWLVLFLLYIQQKKKNDEEVL